MKKNQLSITHPKIVRDWNLEKTKFLHPDQVTATSKKKVWWKCIEGHEYQVSVHSRVRSNGCKICQRLTHVEKARLSKLKRSQSFAVAMPQFVQEWNTTRNDGLSPDTVSYKSNMLVWWICKYGHEWQSTPKKNI